MKQFIVILISLILVHTAWAQQGTLRGTVIDNSNAETLIGVSAVIEGTTTGTSTDLDGKYSLKLAPGNYTMVFSYISYSTQTITDVSIKPGEVTVLDVRLSDKAEELQEVVVVAKKVRNTETALLTLQKKAANVLDGISSETFSRTGDSDAGQAIQRVTGVSVEGGKHVYVRGLGDRYTKTTLNGLDVPGLDPDRNTIQMDIFPSNLIDNIVINKTFAPNLPGDFTGGLVNIVTQDFPETKSLSLSYGTTYRPTTHFNNDFILYKGGSTDLLAFDDGTRAQPFPSRVYVPHPAEREEQLTALTERFGKTMAVEPFNNFLDQNFSIGFGNQQNKERVDIGYNLAFNYGINYQYYDNAQFSEYFSGNSSEYELLRDRVRTAQLGEQNVLWSALAGTSFKFLKKHKISLNLLRSQNAESTGGIIEQQSFETGNSSLRKNSLTYVQRSFTNGNLLGTHELGKNKLEWRTGVTYSSITNPDIRSTSLTYVENKDGVFSLDEAEGATIKREFRDLTEMNYTGRIDYTIPLTFNNGNKSTVKLGLAETYKARDFGIQQYKFQLRNSNAFQFSPNQFFEDNNIWRIGLETNGSGSGLGTFVIGSFQPNNTFSASQNIAAAYIMQELPISEKIKATYGIRSEFLIHQYTGNQPSDAPGTQPLDYKWEEFDFLPSLNLVYNLVDNMNLRLSYGKTLARPSFKERSNVSIYDPITDRRFSGNINLQSTQIHNADIRWEYFFNPAEMISVSGFYKYFVDPIELVSGTTDSREVQPINSDKATVAGGEFELRKNLSFFGESLKDFSISSNLTYVLTALTMTDKEYNNRLNKIKEGESISNVRNMYGQSPYIINSSINYVGSKNNMEAALSYNVQGKRLVIVGNGNIPDIFEQPFHSLNFRAAKRFGLENKFQLSFTVDNILNSKQQRLYEAFKANPTVYSIYEDGRAFGLGFNYTIQ